MIPWNDTVKTALLGTSRAEMPKFTGQNALSQMLQALSPRDDPHALLAAAGTMALHAATGWQPSQTRPPAPLQPLTDRPACSISLGRQLDVLLEGTHRLLLPEMLSALNQAGYRVPDIILPNVLEKGAKQANLRPFILPVLGRPGRWLASQNPAWRYASPEIDSWSGLLDAWQTAVPAERQALLRQLRHLEPARGRQILEHTWRSNSDPMRNQLVKILDINLSLDDEPFLEAALDDRDQQVRRSAADLLARLPESRLAHRLIRHAAGVLSWTPDEEKAITVRFPARINPAMLRDGLPHIKEADLPKLRTRLLTQIIGRMPLDHWTTHWQKSPEEIVRAVQKSAWPRTLTAAFSTAAIRQKNEAWAETLIVAKEFHSSTGRLVPVLSSKTCSRLIRQAAEQSTQLDRSQPLHIFLQHWPESWTVEMGNFWLDQLANLLAQTESTAPNPTLNNLLVRFGQKCPPDLADTAAAKLQFSTNNPNRNWQTAVQKLCQTLALRRDLLRKITGLAPTAQAA